MRILFLLLCASVLRAQQLPHRRPTLGLDFLYNPAMTAPGDYLEFGAAGRFQWTGFDDAPDWFVAQFQAGIPDQRFSGGGALQWERNGPVEYRAATLTTAYRLPVGRFAQLSVGLLGGVDQTRLNGTRFLPADAQDPLLLTSSAQTTSVNLGAGAYFLSDDDILENWGRGFFAGVGVRQVFTSDRDISLTNALHANAVVGAAGELGDVFGTVSLWVDYATPSQFYTTLAGRITLSEVFWTGISVGQDGSFGLELGYLFDRLGDGQLHLGGRAYAAASNDRWNLFGPSVEVVVQYRFFY